MKRYTSKIYSNTKGAYIIIKGRRYYTDEMIRIDGDNDIIAYIPVTNCLSYVIHSINYDINDSITYSLAVA